MDYWDSEYPRYIEVPEGYWTTTTTADLYKETTREGIAKRESNRTIVTKIWIF